MDFRFLHAADIHLDSPLTGLGQFDEVAANRVQTASRDALEAMIQFAIEEQVDFLVIAGDLYDGDWKDHKTGLFFVQQMGRLNSAGIPAFLLHGNHDAASQITKSLPLPENVKVFNHKKPESLAVDGLDVVLHGRSFPEQHVKVNLVPDYPVATNGHFNIGVLHTALEGGTIHANYAPCKVSELKNAGYDYWALGHIHEHRVVETDPYIVYPGNLQGRNIHETGPKGACLVTVEGGAVISVEHVPMDIARWAAIRIDVADIEAFDGVVEAISEGIHTAVEEQADGRLLACRIHLVGETALDGELRARLADLRVEATAASYHRGDAEAWIEKIRVKTTAAQGVADIAARADALGELFQSFAGALDDVEFADVLKGQLQAFRSALPHEVTKDPDDPLLRALVEDDYETIVANVQAELASKLSKGGA